MNLRSILLKIDKIYDKILHFLAGYFVVSIFMFWINWYISFGIITIIAILKELMDKYIKKTFFDWINIIVTLAGGLLACLIFR